MREVLPAPQSDVGFEWRDIAMSLLTFAWAKRVGAVSAEYRGASASRVDAEYRRGEGTAARRRIRPFLIGLHARRSVSTAAFIVMVLLFTACGVRQMPVGRTIGGEHHMGTFVSPFAYETFVRAELAVQAGDDESALDLYQLARAGAADDAFVAARQAGALIRLHRLAEAEEVLAEAEALDAESEALWLARGDLSLARGDGEAAMAAYAQAARVSPESAEPILRIAERLTHGSEGADRALALLASGPAQSAAVQRARFEAALHRGDAQEAVRAAHALAALTPLSRREVLAAAHSALAEGRLLMARRLLQHPALGERPEARALRVQVLLALGDGDAAEALLLAGDSADFGGEGQRARWLLEAGHPEIAQDLAALGVAAGEVGASVGLGGALLQLGDTGAAAAAFSREAHSGGDVGEGARSGIAAALEAGALPALAAEVRSYDRE